MTTYTKHYMTTRSSIPHNCIHIQRYYNVDEEKTLYNYLGYTGSLSDMRYQLLKSKGFQYSQEQSDIAFAESDEEDGSPYLLTTGSGESFLFEFNIYGEDPEL